MDCLGYAQVQSLGRVGAERGVDGGCAECYHGDLDAELFLYLVSKTLQGKGALDVDFLPLGEI